MTSISDLAREAGVSTATVSRALRGLPRVSEATRVKVLDAAVRLGYTPSPHAVGLASGGQTRTVAIVVLFVTRWYFATVVHGAEQVLRRQGYDVLLYNIGGDVEARRRVMLSGMLTKRADALIVVGLGPTPEEVLWMSRHGMPVVTIGSRTPSWPSVHVDDVAVARTAMDHLHQLGHRRIAYVGQLTDDGLELATPRQRRQGYQEAVRAAGQDVEPELELEGHFTVEGGHEAGRRLLALPDRPTAVFCASDEMAFGVMHAAREEGVSVPDDLAVVGVDDHELAQWMGLTTIRQPVVQQGRVAARQVLQLITPSHDDDGVVTEHVEVPTELVVRRSTGPARPGAGGAQRSE